MHSAPLPTSPPDTPDRFDRAIGLLLAAVTTGLLAYKFVLTARINVNWDEFLYLSNVHALERGELRLLLQGAYAHLFGWLTELDGDEMAQVAVARLVMTALLCATVTLTWLLGRRWLTGSAAAVPPFVYLASVAVMHHGGSFRADSMLAPLAMAALVLLTSPERRVRSDWCAGLALGAALTVTVKVVLLAPLVAAMLLAREFEQPAASATPGQSAIHAAVRVSAAAIGISAPLLLLHWLTIPSLPAESVVAFGVAAANKTLLTVPWFAQLGYLEIYVRWQPLLWLLIIIGTLLALAKARFGVAALTLALLPVAIYRNSFPYYYIVMLAPLSILAGFATQEIKLFLNRHATMPLAHTLLGVIGLGLLYQGLSGTSRLWENGQVNQSAVVSAVHQIFPQPVSYVDRCGMIASFPRAGFFMSTWGLETYRERRQPFMLPAIHTRRPAFVLVNTPALDPDQPGSARLLPQDRDSIARFYPRYWGPIRVAGARAQLLGSQPTRLMVPFSADYRLSTAEPVMIDGVLRAPGDVISVTANGVTAVATGSARPGSDLTVTLFLAVAQPPPRGQIPAVSLFSGL